MPKLETKGQYNGRIIGQKLDRSNSGTPSVVLALQVDGGECHGQHAWWNGYMTDKNIDRVIDTMVELKQDFSGDLDAFRDGEESFVDIPCRFTFDYDKESNGYEPKLRVQWLHAIGGGRKSDPSIEASVAEEWGYRMRALVASKRGVAPAPAPVRTATVTSNAIDASDGLPF
jgi:hypothetical protein